MASLDELRVRRAHLAQQQKDLDAEIKIAEERASNEAIAKNAEFLSTMPETEKRVLLKFLEHDRTSCSDTNIANGRYSAGNGRWRCNKCMLMEMLNGEHDGKFTFRLSVDIEEIRV